LKSLVTTPTSPRHPLLATSTVTSTSTSKRPRHFSSSLVNRRSLGVRAPYRRTRRPYSVRFSKSACSAGLSGARPRPPATTTTSLPRSPATGHPWPNGPRRPIIVPGAADVSAAVTSPTFRVVWVMRPCPRALTDIGTSPLPKAYSMLNWPGSTAIPSSMSMLTVSWFSRRRATIFTGRGAANGASADCSVAIYVQQLELRLLEVADRDVREPAHHVVAELVIRGALLAKALAVQAHDSRELHRDCVGVPSVGLEEPRPADRIARCARRHDDWRHSGRLDLDRDSALADDLEDSRGFAGVEQRGARLEVIEPAAARDLVEHRVGHARKDVRPQQQIADGVHAEPPEASCVNACASAVMSMPTGHHAMHLPQPVHPEVSNWSCQVESLSVIHCR